MQKPIRDHAAPRQFDELPSGNGISGNAEDFRIFDAKTNQDIRYRRSERDPLSCVGRLASTVSDAELRILLHLAIEATKYERDHPTWYIAVASVRKIAAATGASTSTVQSALRVFEQRNLITKRQGTAERSSRFICRFLEVETLASAAYRPATQGEAASDTGCSDHRHTPVAASATQGSLDIAQDPRACASIESDKPSMYRSSHPATEGDVWERIATARPEHWPPAQVAEATRWIHGYQAKMRGDHPHPPDARIVAQLLTVCGGSSDGVVRLVQDLMLDNVQPGEKYGWYMAVALQRFHGISPDAWRAKRTELRVIRQRRQPRPPIDEANLTSQQNLPARPLEPRRDLEPHALGGAIANAAAGKLLQPVTRPQPSLQELERMFGRRPREPG